MASKITQNFLGKATLHIFHSTLIEFNKSVIENRILWNCKFFRQTLKVSFCERAALTRFAIDMNPNMYSQILFHQSKEVYPCDKSFLLISNLCIGRPNRYIWGFVKGQSAGRNRPKLNDFPFLKERHILRLFANLLLHSCVYIMNTSCIIINQFLWSVFVKSHK